MPEQRFLIYCSVDGSFVLTLEGENITRQFGSMAEAFSAASELRPEVPIIVFNALGFAILEAVS
jgi:hypothetical protein